MKVLDTPKWCRILSINPLSFLKKPHVPSKWSPIWYPLDFFQKPFIFFRSQSNYGQANTFRILLMKLFANPSPFWLLTRPVGLDQEAHSALGKISQNIRHKVQDKQRTGCGKNPQTGTYHEKHDGMIVDAGRTVPHNIPRPGSTHGHESALCIGRPAAEHLQILVHELTNTTPRTFVAILSMALMRLDLERNSIGFD